MKYNEETIIQEQVFSDDRTLAELDRVRFQNGSELLIDRHNPANERLTIVNADGILQLSIEMTPTGAAIKLSGATVQVTASKKLELVSPNIHIKASEQLTLESEKDLVQHADRDFFSTARIQNIEADLGNVNIKANDDVRLDGERVKLNCTD